MQKYALLFFCILFTIGLFDYWFYKAKKFKKTEQPESEQSLDYIAYLVLSALWTCCIVLFCD